MIGEDAGDLSAGSGAELGDYGDVGLVLEEAEGDLGHPRRAAAVEDVPGEEFHGLEGLTVRTLS